MPESSTEVIRRYIEDAVAAEKGFELQLQAFAEEGDDPEVQALFAQHAQETSSQISRLSLRLEALGGIPSRTKSLLAQLFTLAPKAGHLTYSAEERLTQNLIAAYAVEMSECAMYEALLTAAHLAGDTVTASLATEIESEERQTALRLFQFLPSRSKIAFNVLTAGEVDPSVETRAPDDRLL